MNNKHDNLKGKIFGRLKVIERSKNRNGKWICECSCGSNKEVESYFLINNETTSCGCYRKEKSWTGYEEISGSYFNALQNNAKYRKIEFNITIEYIWSVFLKQNRKCVFTNRDLKFDRSVNSRTQTASLDRTDNSKGYVEGNVQWVHKTINHMKMTLSSNDFINICKEVCKKHNNE